MRQYLRDYARYEPDGDRPDSVLQDLAASRIKVTEAASRAQQSDRTRLVGVLMNNAENDAETKAQLTALLQELQRLGWSEDRNLRVQLRYAAEARPISGAGKGAGCAATRRHLRLYDADNYRASVRESDRRDWLVLRIHPRRAAGSSRACAAVIWHD